jgi:general secretion pathway protein C
MLQGVSGGGPGGGAALFQFPTGGQRLVRVGREVVPGMVLNSVGATHAILNSGGSELRFELNRPGAVQAIATPVAQTSVPAAASTAERQETLDLRLALQPVTSNGRVSGYALKPGTTLPRLAQAGIRPGDVITGVNGSVLDEERLMELSWAMSNSERTEFEVLRDGRKIKVAPEPGSRH